MFTSSSLCLLFPAAAIHPRQQKKCRHLRVKKGSNQKPATHTHKRSLPSMEKQHARVIQSGPPPAPHSGGGYSEDEMHNYIIQKGFTGLRRAESGEGGGPAFL